MTAIAPRRSGIGTHFKNGVLLLASIVFSLVAAEAAVRFIDGYGMTSWPLSEPRAANDAKGDLMDQVPRAPGVDRAWFFTDPAPLLSRVEPPADWWKLYHAIEANPVGGFTFRPIDAFKAWNSVFVGDPCKNRIVHFAPGQLWVYDPHDGQPLPPYRFLPDATLPGGLVTNQMGWRGAPIEEPRGVKTVRIVFVGSSTTVDPHHVPFSWPEFVGHYLNVWAKAKGLPVHFEVLNAGRESIISTDIAAVVQSEVLPLRPDLVLYYEGGNQFWLPSLVPKGKLPQGTPQRPAAGREPPQWLQNLALYSALATRVQAALLSANAQDDGKEWPKPDYPFVWPQGLDEQDPDLAYPKLPINLNLIERDLDHIRRDVESIGAQFALSSFVWMVKDGLVLDPARHKYIIEQLNVANYPFRYRDIERLARFQNRFLAKYAATYGMPFVDIAGNSPLNPDLFIDAVHTNYAGSRIRGWTTFNLLLPTVEQHLADGSWPRPWPAGVPNALPPFQPRHITFACRQ
ncbi:MAG: hypothetical protein JOY64_14600 [Alphaproteobacteria bacterium]|nr:hypothetical protein [Alphaproteobacteria bacterium]MBV8408859.1 hypothetical protein [Alphaproteobacteria bacterium]